LYGTAALVLLLASSPVILDAVRPAAGYRTTLIGLVDPTLAGRLQTLDDIQRRKVDFEVDYFGFRYSGNTGNLVDAYTYYFGAYEKPELFFVRDTLAKLGPDAVAVDAGANTGLYTLVASKYAREVHAFEPFPPVLQRLRRTLDANHVLNVIVHPVGLGESDADLPFSNPPDDNLGMGAFGRTVPGSHDSQRLRVVTGDDYLRQAGVTRVDFIKMDIEGFEKPALAGLRNTLRRDRPVVLLEIATNPAVPYLFKSIDDLRASFPEDYEFLDFVVLDLAAGSYELRPLRMSFDRANRAMTVARPRTTRATPAAGP
jgi:FkbM family methyltransferase